MKWRKKLCFVIAAALALIFLNGFATSDETINNNKAVINYGDRYNKENDQTSKEIKVPASAEEQSGGIIFLPVPKTNEPIILDAL